MYKCMRCGKICDDTDYYHTCNPGCKWKQKENTNFFVVECQGVIVNKAGEWGFCPYCGRPIENG